MPLFSVIIPVFNRPELIASAIDSVLAQTCTDYELIVVDDGSTDQTSFVIAAYADQHPNRIVTLRQPNSGPGAARNAGIAKATGRYIAFLDSDDLWFPWTLACHARALQQYDFPTFVSGMEIKLDAIKGIASHTQDAWESARYPYLFAASGKDLLFGGTPGLTVETNSLRQIGGFPGQFINGEDQDLWLRLGSLPGYVRIHSPPLFTNRQHTGRISSNIDRAIAGARFIFAQEKSGVYPGGDQYRAIRMNTVNGILRAVSLQCLKQRQFRSAWWMYRSHFQWNWKTGRWRYLLGFWGVTLLSFFRLSRSD